ncbi:hypothetical protein ACFSND_32960 [Brevibacillus brevis]|uniref:hypothetical protein n=1 Tax=Brevibacillus brevis TaxID=1393 RepID=UPI00362FFF93
MWGENKLETPFSKLEARIESMRAAGQDPTTTPVYGGPNATMTAGPEPAWYEKAWDWVNGSHANGLSYVPFDGYRAELHKGERVLTAQQNRNLDSNLWSRANQALSSRNGKSNACFSVLAKPFRRKSAENESMLRDSYHEFKGEYAAVHEE